MQGDNPFYTWPVANQTTMIYAMIVILTFLGGAFALEIFRRWRDSRLRLDAEWRAVRQIVAEKELSPEEWGLLERLLRQYGASEPYPCVTLRSHFDACVDRCLQAILSSNDAKNLERHGARLRDIRVRLGLDYVPFGQRIHSTRDLYADQLLWAAPADQAHGEWFRAHVAHLDEAHFFVSSQAQEALPVLKPNQVVRFRLWREEDARYVFSAVLVRVEKAPFSWMFRHSTDLKRMQSRGYFRIPFDQSTSFGIVTGSVDGDASGIMNRPVMTQVRGRVTSLSGGGFAAVVNSAVPKQVFLRWELELASDQPAIPVFAQLVSSQAISGGRYLIRGSFVAIDDEDRDQIAQYVMRKQRFMQSMEARTDQSKENHRGTP
ncbi:MAG: hypothetical protein HYV27_24515 [Candidatus Hydrogenedentes bacterium]|nr:hypothetical protein [Candidatus Hydrogenedentota bacterium]